MEKNERIEVLIDEETLSKRIHQLAEIINEDYKGKNPVFICTLKGAVFFFTDLTRLLNMDCELAFMKAESYSGENSTEEVNITVDIDRSIKGKDVVIVEDIIDTGLTLPKVIDKLCEKEPNSVSVCVLLDKPSRRKNHDITPDYTGFVIPGRFVIGYGLDYNEKYRTLPNISCIVKDDDPDLEKDRESIKKQLTLNSRKRVH